MKRLMMAALLAIAVFLLTTEAAASQEATSTRALRLNNHSAQPLGGELEITQPAIAEGEIGISEPLTLEPLFTELAPDLECWSPRWNFTSCQSSVEPRYQVARYQVDIYGQPMFVSPGQTTGGQTVDYQIGFSSDLQLRARTDPSGLNQSAIVGVEALF